tara:strand:- start:650 stop:1114 length:465 start_codon:yes stop_codon:yes gene_type:complete
MKVIFLDIDGVLNTVTDMKGDFQSDYDRFRAYINLDLVKKLNKLIEKTESKIVISSTWRKLHTQETLQEILTDCACVGEIIGMTGNTDHAFRGLEIRQWLQGNKEKYNITNYIILDDDSDMLLWQANHFFNTDCEFGLTNKIVHKAIRFLNGEL